MKGGGGWGSGKHETKKPSAHRVKVTGSSFLIHAFACSLFIGLCSVTSNMIGHFHSHHAIILIHCGAPLRDVLSNKMVL